MVDWPRSRAAWLAGLLWLVAPSGEAQQVTPAPQARPAPAAQAAPAPAAQDAPSPAAPAAEPGPSAAEAPAPELEAPAAPQAEAETSPEPVTLFPLPPPGGELQASTYGSYPATQESGTPRLSYKEEHLRHGPGSREHEGFFLRLTMGLGIGVTSYREDVSGDGQLLDVATRGLAGLFGVSVGGRVVNNLIVHGDFSLCDIGDAKKKVDGTSAAFDDLDGLLGLLGGGLTYYFMPTNAYVSGSAGIAMLQEERNGKLALQSHVGFGGTLLLGKEWFVGVHGQWGMGAALRGSLYTAKVDIARRETRMHGRDIGLVFSATFN